jgi:hypothetical protein
MYWHCRKHVFNQGQASCLAFSVHGRVSSFRSFKVTETYSKTRQLAELAFGKVQAPFFAKNSAVEELESEAQRRDAKTLRLREARLAKELADRTSATSAPIVKRKRPDAAIPNNRIKI